MSLPVYYYVSFYYDEDTWRTTNVNIAVETDSPTRAIAMAVQRGDARGLQVGWTGGHGDVRKYAEPIAAAAVRLDGSEPPQGGLAKDAVCRFSWIGGLLFERPKYYTLREGGDPADPYCWVPASVRFDPSHPND